MQITKPIDYREVLFQEDRTILHGVKSFDLRAILECGQCFRWKQSGDCSYSGVVAGKLCTAVQQGDMLTLHGVEEAEFYALWQDYFDLRRDYGALKALLETDPVMRRAVAFTPGMRVLRQPPWETLCSFILSANNNIVRIRGIVERLCGLLGEPVGDDYAFPTPQRMAALTEEDLAPIRSGYRAGYLLAAARAVAEGAVRLEPLYTLPLDEARAQLRFIKGVGPKVAECVLLYGFARTECVPVDVWIGRALKMLYPEGIPPAITPVAGLGQQYLFHYVRNCPEVLETQAV